jgi:hypothetical protein
VALCQISSFFGSPTPYKKHECQKTFLPDMVFLVAKGFFYLSSCKNLWMQCLALQLDPKVVFPFQKVMSEKIFPMMVEKCLKEYVTLLFDPTPIAIAQFVL